MKSNLGALRLVSILEGISFLLLIFVGMPLKYITKTIENNNVLGMGHGVLTMIFCVILMLAWSKKNIDLKTSILVFIASMIPFGFLFAEKKLKALEPQS